MKTEMLTNGVRYTAKAAVECIPDINEAVDELLDKHNCPMRAHMQFMIAIDEILTNIASYAYPDGKGDMELSVEFDDDGITMSFKDSGVCYDPLSAKEPDITLSAEERSIGGLGIHLVKKTMDDMRYRREDGQNILTIYKRA